MSGADNFSHNMGLETDPSVERSMMFELDKGKENNDNDEDQG